MKKALIIGPGIVGREYAYQLEILGWNTTFLSSEEGRNSALVTRAIESADVVGLTIPTLRNGAIAQNYAKEVLSKGKILILAEKTLLANHFLEMMPHFNRIGFTATVGGGSNILKAVTHAPAPIEYACGIVNGTLNFLSEKISGGTPLRKAIAEALAKNLCERGENNLSGIVNQELQDVIFKAAILFNLIHQGKMEIKASNISAQYLLENEIVRFLKKSPRCRFILEIKPTIQRFAESDCILAFQNGWMIRGGFVDFDKTTLSDRAIPQGEENCLLVRYEGYPKRGFEAYASGIGAGPCATAKVMVEDTLHLMKNKS
jgi:homoserine dehydrogenase